MNQNQNQNSNPKWQGDQQDRQSTSPGQDPKKAQPQQQKGRPEDAERSTESRPEHGNQR